MTDERIMPIQVDSELELAERRGQRPVLVRSIPWMMIADDAAERQSQNNHSQSLEKIASRGGFGASEAVRVISGLDWRDPKLSIPARDAHKILYAMRVLFERGKRVAEAAAISSGKRPE